MVIPVRFLVVLAVVLVSVPVYSSALAQPSDPTDDSTQEAADAAQGWLQKVDAGAWEAAWEGAADLLADSLTQEEWSEQGAQAWDEIGALRSRRLTRSQPWSPLDHGDTEGPFVLLRYRAEYDAGLYVETVLTVKSDDAWKVAGYEVAPLSGEPGTAEPGSETGGGG